MQIVKCGKCGAQFDVGSMKPGSAFACGKCRSAVQVPAAPPPAQPAANPERPLAFTHLPNGVARNPTPTNYWTPAREATALDLAPSLSPHAP